MASLNADDVSDDELGEDGVIVDSVLPEGFEADFARFDPDALMVQCLA